MQVLFLFVFEENLKISIPMFPEHFISCRKVKYKIYSSFWGLYYKTFYGHNLRISIKSYSVCRMQALPAKSNV